MYVLHGIQKQILCCEEYRYNLYKNLFMEREFQLHLRKNKKDTTQLLFDSQKDHIEELFEKLNIRV